MTRTQLARLAALRYEIQCGSDDRATSDARGARLVCGDRVRIIDLPAYGVCRVVGLAPTDRDGVRLEVPGKPGTHAIAATRVTLANMED